MAEDDRHLHTAAPWIVDGERLGMRRRAPRLGEHTAAVFKEFLGIEGDALRELEERQIAW
jgi:crotonobetainyl-CoA:carnitine CoA-transferase CaiB-like acyl-CoA transferase